MESSVLLLIHFNVGRTPSHGSFCVVVYCCVHFLRSTPLHGIPLAIVPHSCCAFLFFSPIFCIQFLHLHSFFTVLVYYILFYSVLFYSYYCISSVSFLCYYSTFFSQNLRHMHQNGSTRSSEGVGERLAQRNGLRALCGE